jgi:hypothetical protein
LEIECEVLAPCATENQITSENAHKIKCKVLAEGANGPTTPGADSILHENGVFVIPGYFWQMPAALQCRILNGCKTGWAISGAKMSSTSA